jgi:DNA polymerase III epsilon subunit-like protein
MAYLVDADMKGSWYSHKFGETRTIHDRVVVQAETQDEACEKGRHYLQRKHKRMALVKSVSKVAVGSPNYTKETDFDRPWYEMNILAFDTETTGLDAEQNRIIELGFAKFNPETKQFESAGSYFVNDGHEVTPKITELTKITQEMIDDAPTFKNLLFTEKAIMEMFGWADLMLCHNRGFDMAFLLNSLLREQIELSLPPCMCSMEVGFKTDVGQPTGKSGAKLQRLEILAPLLGVDHGEAHRAGDDAKACGNVFLGLARKNEFFMRRGLPAREVVEFFDFCEWPGD